MNDIFIDNHGVTFPLHKLVETAFPAVLYWAKEMMLSG
jgi:hypothetical protein